MKFATVLTTLAVVFSATYAAECTQSQLEAAGSLPEISKFQSACAGLTSIGGTSSAASVKKICENKTCLDAMKAAFKAFPKCEVEGLSLSSVLGQVDMACDMVGSPSASTTTAPAPATSAASSSAAGVSATAAAVVAAVYTYARV